MRRHSILFAVAATLALAPAAMAQTVVYQNDFQSNANGFTFSGGDATANAGPALITAFSRLPPVPVAC